MPDITFTFGFNETFLFSTPVDTCKHNLPSGLDKYLNQQGRIERIIWCALGPGGTYMLGYITPTGEERLTWSYQDYSSLELFKNWSSRIPLSRKGCTIGPNRSFFGLINTTQQTPCPCPYLYKRLPSGLTAIVESNSASDNGIVCVALGYATHWAVIRSDGTYDWPHDAVSASEFYALLERAKPGEIIHIALCPDDSRSFFIAYANGKCEYWLPKKKGLWEKVGKTAELYGEYIRSQQPVEFDMAQESEIAQASTLATEGEMPSESEVDAAPEQPWVRRVFKKMIT